MQAGGEVGWDPISVEDPVPWAIRFFVLYTVVVLAVAFVRWLKVAWHLWLFPNRKLLSWKESAEKAPIRSRALAALSRRFREILKGDAVRNPLLQLQQVEADFLYAWQLFLLKAKSIKKLAVLTIIVSLWVFLLRSVEMFNVFSIQKTSSIAMVSGYMVENLTSLELGTVVVMILYAEYAVLEAALRKRKAAWDFVFRTVEQNIPARDGRA